MEKVETIQNDELIEVKGDSELVILSNSLMENSNIKKMTTLDLNNSDDADLLLNSMQDVDFKINDCIGKELNVTGCYIVERPVESVDDETGEVRIYKKHVTMLFDSDGKSYVTGSTACYNSFSDIVTIKGLPSKDNPLILIPIKVDAEEKGHSYLKLKLKINKK